MDIQTESALLRVTDSSANAYARLVYAVTVEGKTTQHEHIIRYNSKGIGLLIRTAQFCSHNGIELKVLPL